MSGIIETEAVAEEMVEGVCVSLVYALANKPLPWMIPPVDNAEFCPGMN